MSVGAWDLGKEMLENGENHDNDQRSRRSWSRCVEAGAPVRRSKHTVLEIQDGQCPRKSWLCCVEAGTPVRRSERAILEIRMANHPGGPGEVEVTGDKDQNTPSHMLDTLGVQTTSDSNVPSGYRLGTF